MLPASAWKAGLFAAAIPFLALVAPAAAQEATDEARRETISVSADYTADVSGPVSGGRSRAGRALDDLLVGVDVDLEQATGWDGATAHASFLNNTGGEPNDLAGTLQGVDNIEVGRPRGRLFEAWVEQAFAAGSLRAGLYDLNSEFYNTESAGLLTAPAFGIGSELAATGPNGPSIFPSTALALRVRIDPRDNLYIQAAALNAHAGVLGDPGGVDTHFGDGALYIVEAGWTGRGKVALGAWRYSKRQPALFETRPDGDAASSVAQGAYLLIDQPLRGGEGDVRAVSGFVRLGVSDGKTTPFRGGGQAGVLVSRVFADRPESALSFGVNHGHLSADFRQSALLNGVDPASGESAAELTYADNLTSRISLQPSLQYVVAPGGDQQARDAVVLTLRARIHLK